MIKRIFEREEENGEYSLQKNILKIGVFGLSDDSGVGVVGTALAWQLSRLKDKRVSVVQVGKKGNGSLYNSLGMDLRFEGRKFTDAFSEYKNGKSVSKILNLDDRINWILPVPNEEMRQKEAYKYFDYCHIINNITSDITVSVIYDCDGVEDLLLEMDKVIFVVDPLPSKIFFGYDRYMHLKECENKNRDIIWVLNKENTGINKGEFVNSIKVKNWIKIPYIPQEHFYTAQYNCIIPYKIKEVKGKMEAGINEIIQRLW